MTWAQNYRFPKEELCLLIFFFFFFFFPHLGTAAVLLSLEYSQLETSFRAFFDRVCPNDVLVGRNADLKLNPILTDVKVLDICLRTVWGSLTAFVLFLARKLMDFLWSRPSLRKGHNGKRLLPDLTVVLVSDGQVWPCAHLEGWTTKSDDVPPHTHTHTMLNCSHLDTKSRSTKFEIGM
jgi:hypothetical protein